MAGCRAGRAWLPDLWQRWLSPFFGVSAILLWNGAPQGSEELGKVSYSYMGNLGPTLWGSFWVYWRTLLIVRFAVG